MGGKGEKGDRKGDGGDRKGGYDDRKGGGKKGEKGGKGGKGEKGEKGEKGGKGKGKAEKVKDKKIRGKVILLMSDKPSGFIQRNDGEYDVFFDLASVLDEETVVLYDQVEFDTVEWDGRLYGMRVKKLPKEADTKGSLQSTDPATASKKGLLTGAGFSLGGLSLGPGGAAKPGAGKLTGGISFRPGGALAVKKEDIGADKKKDESKGSDDEKKGDDDEDGCCWGRVVSVQGSFGFLKRLGGFSDASTEDVFFRAKDVVGMNGSDPGKAGSGLQIVLPHGRMSHGHDVIWLAVDDELSYMMSKDHKGAICAVDVRKENKGAWRTGRRARTGPSVRAMQVEPFKDKLKRLVEQETEQVLQSVSLFKEVLEHESCGSHLDKIVGLLARPEMAEDNRSEVLYRVFLNSIVFTQLRTTIIKFSSGKHCGSFLEECLRVFAEIAYRNPPEDIGEKLPLQEIVEAWEGNVREGSSATRKGVPEEVKQNLQFLQKQFPDKNLDLRTVFGGKAKGKGKRTAAEDFTELLEADDYRDMPILPTSAEMLGQCAFEIQENMRTYERVEDFIQTHFMLLREDYIEPLRAGIKLFMQDKHSPKDLHVYSGVKVVAILSTREGLVYRIQLQKSQTRNIKWEKSKQLMYGSLLCFSNDNFETLIWATVWRRDEDLMYKDAMLDVRLPFETYDDRLEPGTSFTCIENVTIYFEAYRHVLIALQSMRPQDVPFQHTLLAPQPTPEPPCFLKPETDMFNFRNVFHQCEKEGASAPKNFKILGNWPEELQANLDIDPSQLEAIKHSLTNQMALVQGPPGTGKTWVGLRIVQALLDNTRGFRHSPILVVCYTNHALDQFLEGIFKFCERVTRIGSRSNSEVMAARNLKELVFQIPPSREYLQARRMLNERRDVLRAELARCLKNVDKHLVDLEDVQDMMTECQWESFYEGYVEYLAEDAKKVVGGLKYGGPADVDDKLFEKMMTAWLDSPDKLEKLAPVPGNRPVPKLPGLDDEDEEEDKKKEDEDGKEGEEEEAEQEKTDRKLDDKTEEKKGPNQDFVQELSKAWLPYTEDYVNSLRDYELRGFDWRQENLWRMSRAKRKETYSRWLLEVHHEARDLLPGIAHQLERNADNREALERDRKISCLREMEVVGMTTTAVSKYQVLLKELRPEVVIVEEAAEVLEAHILTALHPRTQHVILIGDHQQLRPSTAVYRLSKNFHLDVSLFERLIKNGAAHVTLLQQRRMHPMISRLIRPLYPLLRDHRSTGDYPEISGVGGPRCFFLRHRHFEDNEGESHSKENTFEANFVSALCAHLVKSGYGEDQITVLSPYLGQVRLLKQKMKRDPTTQDVQITAVDNFQGEENDIIVISLVRSNRQKSMGFLAVDNRINVALTRARHGMYVVGNADMLKGHKLWSSIMEELGPDISDEMPLVDVESGATMMVKSADDISVLLDSPIHRSNGEGENAPFQIEPNSRWAALGAPDGSDRKGKGKGRDRDRGGGKGKGGGGNWDRDRDRGGGGKGGRDRDRGGKGDRDRERDFRDIRDKREGASEAPRMSLDEYRRGGKEKEEEPRSAGGADEEPSRNKKGEVVLRMGGR